MGNFADASEAGREIAGEKPFQYVRELLYCLAVARRAPDRNFPTTQIAMKKPFALAATLVCALSLLAVTQSLAQQATTPTPPPPAPPADKPAGDPAAGQIKALTCTGCHGIPGYVNVYPTYHVPKVAGQYATYIVSALESYRAGERDHPTMHAQGLGLSNQDIADIGAYFRALAPEDTGAAANAADTPGGALAQKLCASCHGKTGISPSNAYPILAGQYQDYLVRAMKDYQSGARENAIMRGLVANLSGAQIERLASFYAGQEYLRTLEAAEE